jgi:predicted dehydrogenase
MGKRRVRCLRALGVGRILGWDPREDRRQEAAEKYQVEPAAALAEALAQGPSLMIVSTPPDTHVGYAQMAARAGMHFFTEAGVMSEGFDELERLAEEKGLVAAPSCTMRFFPGPKKIKEVVSSGAIGRPCSFVYHSGQYLPDWHPWESIRDFYVSKPVTGACREIVPFELVWLTDVVGPFGAVKAFRGRLGDLDCDIDDVYHLLLTTADAGLIGHLTVDVLARPAVRAFRLIGTEGQVVWDADAAEVRWYTMADDRWETWRQGQGTVEAGYINPEEPYIEEIERVLLAMEGVKPYGYSYREDGRILDLLYQAEADSSGAQ